MNLRDIWWVTRRVIESSDKISVSVFIEYHRVIFLLCEGLHVHLAEWLLVFIDNLDLTRFDDGLDLKWGGEICETLGDIRSREFNAHIIFMEFFWDGDMSLKQAFCGIKSHDILMIWLHEAEIRFFLWKEWISAEENLQINQIVAHS